MGSNPSSSDERNTKPCNYSLEDCAKCVREFSASKGEYVGTFIEQIRAVQTSFHVNDTDLKLLILKKLSGSAEEWLQSKPSHIKMSANQLLEELEHVYGNRARLVDLQMEFLGRNWRWRDNERFFHYYQDKVKLGSNFNLPEDVLVQRIVDGIDNPLWERQINAHKIKQTSVLLEKMENAIRDHKLQETTVVECCYCKKENHPSAKCHFKPDPTKESKPEPCKYCKKVGHSPEKCFFKSDSSKTKERKTNPCKVCKKPGHLSENCYFKSCGFPERPKSETKKKAKTESSSSDSSDETGVTSSYENKRRRWRCKSVSKNDGSGSSTRKDELPFFLDFNSFNFKN